MLQAEFFSPSPNRDSIKFRSRGAPKRSRRTRAAGKSRLSSSRSILRKRHSSKAGREATSSAPVFAALGDSTRLRLVSRLCDGGPMAITRLTAGSRGTRQAISRHLRVLEGAGLVHSRRRGRETVWKLQQRRLREALHYLDVISMQWDE